MIKQLACAISALIVLAGCDSKTDVQLTTINGFPAEVQGCSCYFSKNIEDFKAKKFIYLDTYYEGIAFISIDDKLIKVNLDDPKDNKVDISIEFTRDDRNGSETWDKTGVLTVKTEDGLTLQTNFIGECGC